MLSMSHAQLHDGMKKNHGEKMHSFTETRGQKDMSQIQQKSYSEEYGHHYPHHHHTHHHHPHRDLVDHYDHHHHPHDDDHDDDHHPVDHHPHHEDHPEWEAEKEYLAETLADKINSNVLVYLEGGMKNTNKKGKSIDIPDAEEIKEYATDVAHIMGEKTIGIINAELLNALKGKLTSKEYEQLASTLEENAQDIVASGPKNLMKGTDLDDDEIEEVIEEVTDTLVDDVTGGPNNPLEELSKEVNVHEVPLYTPETF